REGFFKFRPPAADASIVETPVLRPHHIRSDPRDLEALATIWRWEGKVQDLLPRVLEKGEIDVRFQAVFDIRATVPVLRGYEAYARFPTAPELPTGLWFATAARMGLAEELSVATGRKALQVIDRLPGTAVLFVNTIPEAVCTLAAEVPEDTRGRVVFDLPASSFADEEFQVADLHSAGIGVSFDGEPLAEGNLERLKASGASIDYVKVDAIDDGGSLGAIAELAEWCHRNRIFVVAKRVESSEEVDRLRYAGVDWIQGYAFGSDVTL